jgi:hypothetical protein
MEKPLRSLRRWILARLEIQVENDAEQSDCTHIEIVILSKTEIDNNIAWLVQNGSAPVRYLTYLNLLNADPDSAYLRKLWVEVQKDSEVMEMFAKQKQNGSWCAGGPWALAPSYVPKGGCTPVSPKYVTTTWLLQILGDMGFDTRDERIRKAYDYVLSFQCKNGFIAESDKNRYEVDLEFLDNMPCRFSLILLGLGKVGAGHDTRLGESYKLLLHWQRDDGGWILEKHKKERNWYRSCPYSTFHSTYALYTANNDKYKDSVKKGLAFLLDHLSQKEENEINRFFYHGHCIIHELLMFSQYGIGMGARPVSTILEWLLEMYNTQEGRFKYSGKPIAKYSRRKDGMDVRVAKYRLYHLIEDDWLTYYITRVLKSSS